MKLKLTAFQIEECFHKASVRLETIQDDPESADAFETVDSLTKLESMFSTAYGKRKSVEVKLSPDEAAWLTGEIENAAEIAYCQYEFDGDMKALAAYKSFTSLQNKLSFAEAAQ